METESSLPPHLGTFHLSVMYIPRPAQIYTARHYFYSLDQSPSRWPNVALPKGRRIPKAKRMIRHPWVLGAEGGYG